MFQITNNLVRPLVDLGTKAKALFFDLGETLVTQNIENNMVTSKALKQIAKILPEKVPVRRLSSLYALGYSTNQAIRSRHHVEIPIETWMFRLLRAALSTKPTKQLVHKAIRIVVNARAANAITFPDSVEVIRALAGGRAKLGIISNVSSHEVAMAILRKAGLTQYFDVVVTSALTGIRKPDVGIFRYALLQFNINPQEAVLIGDSEHHDIEGGYAAGLRTVLITRKHKPDSTIADYHFPDLKSALNTLQKL
jgi:HAD superfamily hydrolase (TIGR01549 family)